MDESDFDEWWRLSGYGAGAPSYETARLAWQTAKLRGYQDGVRDVVAARPPQEPGADGRLVIEDGKVVAPRRWKCPRCNFINGLKLQRTICGGCSYPGDDTRSWITGSVIEGDDTRPIEE